MKQAKILVVDDQPHIHRLLSLALESRGYEVKAELSMVDGLHSLGWMEREDRLKWRPDVMIVDWKMPGYDGLEMLYLVRKHPVFNGILFFLWQ